MTSKYKVETVVIERYNCLDRPALHDRIQHVTCLPLGEFESPEPISPEDIIIVSDTPFKVVHRIFGHGDLPILRVVSYNDNRIRRYGGMAWNEAVPLFPPYSG